MPQKKKHSKANTELALKRYDAIMRYFVYENSIYWSRSQFFLIANIGLYAAYAARFAHGPGTQLTLVLTGLFLSYVWYLILRSGEYWTTRWEQKCRALEAAAFGDIEIFRNCRPRNYFPTKVGARMTATLFLLLWGLAMIMTTISLYAVEPVL